MDFIFMLTRNDRTIEDAACLVDAAAACRTRRAAMLGNELGRPAEFRWMSHRLAGKREIAAKLAQDALCGVEIGASEDTVYTE